MMNYSHEGKGELFHFFAEYFITARRRLPLLVNALNAVESYLETTFFMRFERIHQHAHLLGFLRNLESDVDEER